MGRTIRLFRTKDSKGNSPLHEFSSPGGAAEAAAVFEDDVDRVGCWWATVHASAARESTSALGVGRGVVELVVVVEG